MLKGDAFLGWVAVEKGTLAQGDINITIHGPKKPPEEKMAKGSGDFTDCMNRIVPAMAKEGKSPDDPEAFCAWYEHEQSGSWPGEKRASTKSADAFLAGFGYEFDLPDFDAVLKAWSDAAREASAAARRGRGEDPAVNPYSGSPGHLSTQGGAEAHVAATNMGWEHAGRAAGGSQQYEHPSLPGHKMTIQPGGAWAHEGPNGSRASGSDSDSMKNYLTGLHRA